ncbi:MAG: hypothetical protein JWO38_4583 [Gemmataceae bacterium]|nr:hypothetical protein [Gemmataceae bacterium]
MADDVEWRREEYPYKEPDSRAAEFAQLVFDSLDADTGLVPRARRCNDRR